MSEQKIRLRLNRLREKMKEYHCAVCIIPTGDPHQSEYVGEHFALRKYFSGFTGSAGTLAVTEKEALLWTDGRYYVQAERELKGTGIALCRAGAPGEPDIYQWLEEYLKKQDAFGFLDLLEHYSGEEAGLPDPGRDAAGCIAVDGRMISVEMGRRLEECAKKGNMLFLWQMDLAGETAGEQMPPMEHGMIFALDTKYTGMTSGEKLAAIREKMMEEDVDGHLICTLDDIAWITNLRGRDIPCNPVFYSYMYIDMAQCYLFADPECVPEELVKELSEEGITLRPYEQVYETDQYLDEDSLVLVQPDRMNYFLYKKLLSHCNVKDGFQPSEYLKAVKNRTELEHLRETHVRDGAAMTKFLYWIKHTDPETLTEWQAGRRVDELRSRLPGYLSPSFDTISAYGPNAAMMHYRAAEENCAALKKEGLLLVDTGGQFLGGTTDVTRTVALGPVSEEEKRCYTNALRGMLRLQNACFLKGCTGRNVDILARGPLWQQGIDYRCGTGHGVGFCLGVHEGPHSIRWKMPAESREWELEPGMVVTDEPGAYETGRFGIRIENQLTCVLKEENEYGTFMAFEPLTLVPIDLEPVMPELMSREEIGWLNAYHKKVYDSISPYLQEDERRWLAGATKELKP